MSEGLTVTRRVRGLARVQEILSTERCAMQQRAYKRSRPYLAGALYRLRKAYPGFKTVVFNAKERGFAFIFTDGLRPHEAPKAFKGLGAVCAELAQLSEIERLTAGDGLWQVSQPGPQPEVVIEQYRHVEDEGWNFWMRRPLNEARYYMRQAIYSRIVHGSHRPGYGKRLVGEDGSVVDEWADPIEPMILRVLNERGAPIRLEPLEEALDEMARYANPHQPHYIWDVFKACNRLVSQRLLRRLNPRASEIDARFQIRSIHARFQLRNSR